MIKTSQSLQTYILKIKSTLKLQKSDISIYFTILKKYSNMYT